MSAFKKAAVEVLVPVTNLAPEEIEAMLVKPPQPEMGDLGFPVFILAKKFKKAPAQIATQLAEEIDITKQKYLTDVKAVGPYVNFCFSLDRLCQETLKKIIAQPKEWGKSTKGQGKTVVIDFSSPNIAKPLGVHHIRSTMLGAALARIYEQVGWNVEKVNYLGDWGTTFGQLMVSYKNQEKEHPNQPVDIHALLQLYLKFHAAADENEDLNAEARDWFKKLEEGDAEAVKLWQLFREESLKSLKQLYNRMGVNFPDEAYKGEAFYNDKMPATIQELKNKNLLVKSDGAEIVDLDKFQMPPFIILKRDGATTYATRDIASAKYRYETFKFDKSLYVVANQQELHFRQLFTTLNLMGYEWAKNCEHVKFGMLSFGAGVFGEEAATGSTRKGHVIFLEEVLAKAVEKAKNILKENAHNAGTEECNASLAENIGVGAVIFSEFLQRRLKDVVFTWDKVLNLHGDSGPYLQYTHARLSSVLKKYTGELNGDVVYGKIKTPLEKEVLLKLLAYNDVLEDAVRENEPSLIATYLLELAAVFNRVFADKEKHRLISEDIELTKARMALVFGVKVTLARGLEILGIFAPEKM